MTFLSILIPRLSRQACSSPSAAFARGGGIPAMIPEKSRSAKMRTEYPQDIHNGAKYPPCINKLSTRAGREEGTSERESLEAAQDFSITSSCSCSKSAQICEALFYLRRCVGPSATRRKTQRRQKCGSEKGRRMICPAEEIKKGVKLKSTASRWKRAYQYPAAQSAPMKNMMILLEDKKYE